LRILVHPLNCSKIIGIVIIAVAAMMAVMAVMATTTIMKATRQK
jgi:hypothetical protein